MPGYGHMKLILYTGYCYSMLGAVKMALLSCPYCCFHVAIYFPSALGLVVVLLGHPRHLFYFCHVHLAND